MSRQRAAVDPRPARGSASGRRAWGALFAGSLAVIGAAEAFILELHSGYFTSGFLGATADSAGEVLAYFGAAALCDAALVLLLWSVCLLALRALGARSLESYLLTGFLGLVVPGSLDFARYVAGSVLGRITNLVALWDLAGRSAVEVAVQALDHLPPLGWLLAGAALGCLVVVGTARWIERSLPGIAAALAPPTICVLLLGSAACGVLASLVLSADSPLAATVRAGVIKKPSTVLLVALANRVTDVDGDGSGLLSRPPDPDPFDGDVHVYALDLPGNGRDENRLAGDHPPGFVPVDATSRASVGEGELPPAVVVFFLETFRGDLIGRRFGGREITPFMNRLAREGASSEHAYANLPLTYRSRLQLYQGTLIPGPGRSTLADDFRELGFEIAHFSAQDDSFGDTDRTLELQDSDRFYDARQDRERHVGRSTSSSTLHISWKLLVQRVREFLDQRDATRPLFLYVNFVDTHFPYHHQELDDVFGIDPIARHDIMESRRDRVWATYVNAAANVDRGVEAVVRAVRAHFGDRTPAIAITADHGEALYERGLLGHGQELDALGTRVPLILWGIGGEWPEPLAPSDLRGLLLRNLAREPAAAAPPRARFVPVPGRRIFQYLGPFERARLLALRSVDEVWIYEISPGRFYALTSEDQPRELRADARESAFVDVIRNWEALRLRDRSRRP